MHPALVAMLTQTVTHVPYTGQDRYGKPTYGAAVQRATRIQYVVQRITTADGQERVSTTTLFFNGDFTLNVRDKLTLPDTTSPAIQQVYSAEDPLQPGVIDHWRVLL